MILKGSQRSGGNALAAHLMNKRDNDHVTLFELRGFISSDLKGAFQEAYAVSKGTRCEQYLFSLSLNPPQAADVSERDFVNAINRAEEKLGLHGQPRAVIFHEKEGRRHAHVVWSRIDVATMTAVNLPHFKRKLSGLARDLYLDHGWSLPDGLQAGGGKSPLNFTLAEWQQAKRLKIDPREIKQVFQDAWKRTDGLQGFTNALTERGYFLARGDRRGFVAIDTRGEVFSVARFSGVKAKDVRAKLGDPKQLPALDDVRDDLAGKLTAQIKSFVSQVDEKHDADMEPLTEARTAMVKVHRRERRLLSDGQNERWQQEAQNRSARLNKGLKGLWQSLSGAAAKVRSENLQQSMKCLARDQDQRDLLVATQMRERRKLQEQMTQLRRKHAQDRRILSREVANAVLAPSHHKNPHSRERSRAPEYPGLTL